MGVEYLDLPDGIVELFDKTLTNEERLIRTVLVGEPLVYLAGREFAERYMQNRIEAGILLRSLRTSQRKVDQPDHRDYKRLLKEVKECPDLPLDSSMVIWDDYVALVDDDQIMLTKNSDNAEVMKKMFDFIWEKA